MQRDGKGTLPPRDQTHAYRLGDLLPALQPRILQCADPLAHPPHLQVIHRHAELRGVERLARRRALLRPGLRARCRAACCARCAHGAGHPGVQPQVPEPGGAGRGPRHLLLAAQELAVQEARLGGLCAAQQAGHRRGVGLLQGSTGDGWVGGCHVGEDAPAGSTLGGTACPARWAPGWAPGTAGAKGTRQVREGVRVCKCVCWQSRNRSRKHRCSVCPSQQRYSH